MIALVVLFVILFAIHRVKHPIKYWVINLKSNKDRFDTFINNFTIDAPVERYDAVCGKNLKNIEKYMTPTSYNELLLTERRGYRTKHYQQTRGGVGCYLSHYNIIRKLVWDPMHDYYVVFEDDVTLVPGAERAIKDAIRNAPNDWDIILFYTLMENPGSTTENAYVRKLNHFWGMQGYVINRRGARKISDHRANIQIDSKLSLMAKKNMLNVYSLQNQLSVIRPNYTGTDIQIYDVKHINGIDPFVLEDD